MLPYSDQQFSWTFGGPILKDRAALLRQLRARARAADLQPLEPVAQLQLRPVGHADGERRAAGAPRLPVLAEDAADRPRQQVAASTCPTTPRYTGGASAIPSSAITTDRHSSDLGITLTQVLGSRMVNEIRGGYAGYYWIQQSIVPWPDHPYPGARLRHADHPAARLHHRPGAHQLARGRAAGHLRVPRQPDALVRRRRAATTSRSAASTSTSRTRCSCATAAWASTTRRAARCRRTSSRSSRSGTTSRRGTSRRSRRIVRILHAGRRADGAVRAAQRGFAGWMQDDWQIGSRLTLNLGVRYDLDGPASTPRKSSSSRSCNGRPHERHQQLGPARRRRLRLTDRTVIRGGGGRFFADPGSHTPTGRKLGAYALHPQILNDGRADFAANPFNGRSRPSSRWRRRCAPSPAAPNCLRRSLETFAAPDNEIPYSNQASFGMQRQFGSTMSFEADYVYTGHARAERRRSTSTSPTTRRPARTTRSPTSASGRIPTGARCRSRLSIGESELPRPADGVHQAHERSVAGAGHLPARRASGTCRTRRSPAGCQYVTTLNAAGQPVCDVPVDARIRRSRDEWYLTGDQRHRATFNGIWEIGVRLPGERPVPLRRQRLGDAHLRRRRAADRRQRRPRARRRHAHRAQQLRPAVDYHAHGHARAAALRSRPRQGRGHRRSLQRVQPHEL